jgi:hypothetical protein
VIDLIQAVLFVVGAAIVGAAITVIGMWIISPAFCLIVSGLGLMAGTINGMIQNRKNQQ